ncbi:dihydroxyacetone kinase subunit L [Halobacillus halophilus]|uniref:phosphoenolpyruvate--glycerone phosphotransferase n=1 Tax=Halobacillus halophilus (strain ATCC 35676 / DSM 2266 / JCM 20832 / KCTC 3685 / LMG 17431 / NBRC 102448 / NCIMB 2269) TaxID=866895 RepID=I0JQA6_HALH3|nr:dihydroxyacetone kinase subunit DhaL [Halobacillus halophilus]ASF40343.1 dihydroxyacetone kinase subunit L [Halobacillus halophilus]CCG46326.1 dihydroxyacetone kinase subunit DhaL [Halobacillus halophilus DSM 2266]
MKLEVSHALDWIHKINEKVQDHKDELTSLDQAIGDGDHGINMSRGFQEAVNKISGEEYSDVSEVWKDVATTLMSKVGGASGPLYGTVFLKMSTAVKGVENVDFQTFSSALKEAVAGIKQRGKAEAGEKTMLDVWEPLADKMSEVQDFDRQLILDTAQSTMESTKDLVATKGRASYLKERSKGHIDPGAMSSYYVFEALADCIKGDE